MTNLLFSIEPQLKPDIEGLGYIEGFISDTEEKALLGYVDAAPWNHDLKRRVQHYGYRYDYKVRIATQDSYLGPLPDWLELLAQRLVDQSIFKQKPDQVIVNEYLPGQGISAHIDCVPCFGEVIASLSLGVGAVMEFTKGQEKQALYLQPCSVTVLSGPARYEWTHAIPARKSDTVNGIKLHRGRRVSLTFRTMVLF